MILDISDTEFENLFNDEKLFLPIRWNENDFSLVLNKLFKYYIKKIETVFNEDNQFYNSVQINNRKIKSACNLLTKAVKIYLNGFPSNAYESFEKAMKIFMEHPLKIYQKSVTEQFQTSEHSLKNDNLNLFRVTVVPDSRLYERERIFHTPYNLRSKVSTSRYSIAGYPSLYLGTSLELCCEEIHMNPYSGFSLASIFKLERTIEHSNINIRVIELGVKPQDFINSNNSDKPSNRQISHSLLQSNEIRSDYLLWYPLIAACSYVRTNKGDPFAAEYIIPQLLMQWVRNEINVNKHSNTKELVGIRYFSCASLRSSDMGFNYVFPTSGYQISSKLPYCSILSKAFYLSTPIYIHEYDSIHQCETHLRRLNDFGSIGS